MTQTLQSEIARLRSQERCAHCGWPVHERVEDGCTRRNCSMRPMPEANAQDKRLAEAMAVIDRLDAMRDTAEKALRFYDGMFPHHEDGEDARKALAALSLEVPL